MLLKDNVVCKDRNSKYHDPLKRVDLLFNDLAEMSLLSLRDRHTSNLLTKSLYIIFLCIILQVQRAEGALLALPSGEREEINWERALVVYDRLSQQQTVIGEVSISSSPSHFAILLATPQVPLISYTTTRLWRKLKPYISQKSRHVKRLKLSVYSVFKRAFISKDNVIEEEKSKTEVLRSNDTQVHSLERDLHEWLIRRGLSLTPEQALSVKKVYREGFVITAMHVKPRHLADKPKVRETWTSTWVFTHEVRYPYYLHLAPTPLQLSGLTSQLAHHNRDQDRSRLKLSFLSDEILAYQPKSPKDKEINLESTRAPLERQTTWEGVISTLGRVEVSELNNTLSNQSWSFNRRGLLSSFEFTPSFGFKQIRGFQVEPDLIRAPVPDLQERVYKLEIPVELALGIIFGLGYFMRSRRRPWA